ncbi:MAG TPA: hypothetical protein VGR98_27960 [Streptosporangiaceae bacterium]|nr:hypothetical protein [Streptosporangiaceae bacterium]
MSFAQKWLAGLIGLGALYIVLAPNSHITQAFGAAQTFISGTEHTAITGQA